MSARNYVHTIGAGETVTLPAGRYFYIRTASFALDVVTEGNPGAPVRFIGIGAGAKFGPVAEGQGWRFLKVTSAAAQSVEVTISDDGDFEQAADVTVAGVVTTTPQAAATLPSTADFTNIDQAAAAQVLPATVRRRAHVKALSSNTSAIRVADADTAAARGMELQPGEGFTFETTAAIYAIALTADNQGVCLVEEI